MKKNINKLPEYFKIEKLINDKRVVVFLICLLISTSLWFLNALSKDYSTTIAYPVKYVNPPSKQFLANEPPSKLELKIDAHGFTLLRYKLSLSFSPIILNLTNITKDLKPEDGIYKVPSSGLMRRIKAQVSSEISILEVQPETLEIILDSLSTITVPVKPNVELKFKSQFNLQNPVKVIPAEVKITGPSSVIDTISELSTQLLKLDDLDATVEKYADVLKPKATTISPEKVTLRIDVEKFTEKELKIPLIIRNRPDSLSVKLFPSEVKVTCLVGLSEFEDVTANDFSAVVDYADMTNNALHIPVKIDRKSSFIQLVRVTPEAVEYLIETN
ncbi:CdaR family protein [Maribellus sp. YY47]|uniref:CdaR family protein n=1 Tax=Maribellus sp. YY47 TaxID=2929486 RepID=UPI002000924E|nr:CdaR family protein [Maribellus sp. YY47]MCK3684261.1 CdaR family protein [Maribellus sp. YY47]